jgi:ribonuclease G
VKKIIINSDQWQIRVAIIEDETLKNIYFEPHTQDSLERSFFKGIISKVLPGIQTAFVNIGQERAGFTYIRNRPRACSRKNL